MGYPPWIVFSLISESPLQLQCIRKRYCFTVIDAVKQGFFGEGGIISLPWLKPKEEPVADMGELSGLQRKKSK
jgi:hypothetical protein